MEPWGGLSVEPVIGCFLGNRHIMYVALPNPGRGNPNEAGVVAHGFDRVATGIAHGRTYPADQLMDDGDEAALVGHAAFDSFGYEFFGIGAFLEVAVAGALLLGHGAQRAHAAVGL